MTSGPSFPDPAPRASAPRTLPRIDLASHPNVDRFLRLVNPLMSTPSAPLQTIAGLEAFLPSLMPRASLHQGMAAGLAILSARAMGAATNSLIGRVVGRDAPLPVRLAVHAALVGAGAMARRIPDRTDEARTVSAARSSGQLAVTIGAGGALYDIGSYLRERYPAQYALRPAIGALAGLGTVGYIAQRRLETRDALIQHWTDQDKPATFRESLAISTAVSTVGVGMARGFLASRRGMIDFFGAGAARSLLARSMNLTVWVTGGWSAYLAFVSYVAKANEKIEPAYAVPPTSAFVSGTEESVSPYVDLGLQGRRFVTDVVTDRLIEEVMGEPAVAHPIRAYVGYDTEPLYQAGRAELALEELDRLGAFDRTYLLLVSPTGTGWVDQTMVESAELLTRGDIATCCIQYGRSPSFLAIHKVALGRSQFRQLLWGVKQRLIERPPERRPKVLVFGESLGAWSSSDVVMYQGVAGFDHYGIDAALWVGLPGLAKWSKTGMKQGRSPLASEGTVAAFDNHDELAELDDGARGMLRAVVLDHDNDPIAVISPQMIYRRPDWLRGERGRGVPPTMEWSPVITFVHTMVDAMNAMRTVPGEFKSFGHDYRGDMARFVHTAYHLPEVTDEQIAAVESALRRLELERGERIAAVRAEDAPPPPQRHDTTEVGGVPLRQRRRIRLPWRRRREAAGDIQ